ncbi:TadE/TadG family type IV pilus assembly protein [Paraburkholderia phosphatilytica]|uniref:TadE/TadG family type IV pilus assembly protein n=1 Tax=Paraburkholderia phosphatilytica TaxID=2282883 RepID=UPI000E5057E6|nr:TadE/TadG family type IV pilus assembly protein [Paraburkholderia phosphatilytica]
MHTLIPSRCLRNPLHLWRDTRGSVTVTFALLLVPMMLILGLSFDYARLVQVRAALQNAVDEAAVAGASAFTGTSAATTAQTVATNYFNQAILPPALTRGTPTVTTNANGTTNGSIGTNTAAPAYSVTVTASATVNLTLLSLISPAITVNATATAGSPITTASASFQSTVKQACDRNTAYLYEVPTKSGGGYDYSTVPTFSTGSSGNYYYITSSDTTVSAPSNNTMPTMTPNQPLGIALYNQTNGNVSRSGCGVTGANSYGAPPNAQQWFYSSLVANGESPSQNTNYTYTVTVTAQTSNGNTTITGASGSQLYQGTWTSLGSFTVPSVQSGSNNLYQFMGVNGGPSSNCSSVVNSSSTSGHGSSAVTTTTTTYTCQTQYFTTATSTQSNCSLYVQTGLTNGNVASMPTSAPSAAVPNCFNPATQTAANFAPSCAQISAMKSGGGTSDMAAAIAFWWDDAGGESPGESSYGSGPSTHCSAASVNGAGYGEDCQYKNNSFVMQCNVSGGSGSGYTEVVLTK